MTSNADIVAAARGWLGTRFHHQGRIKKTTTHRGGVDCLGLLVGIARDLDLRLPDGTPLAGLDQTDYTHFPDTDRLRRRLELALYPVPVKAIEPGHALLLRIESLPQHMAIVSTAGAHTAIIHAYAPSRAVVEHVLDDAWRQRIVAAYRLF